MELAKKRCRPCEVGVPPLSEDEAKLLAGNVPDWTLGEGRIEREFKFRTFRLAVDFVDHVAELAEGEGHHPDILISYNRVRLTLTTHNIKGLSENDFIFAAKVDRLFDK